MKIRARYNSILARFLNVGAITLYPYIFFENAKEYYVEQSPRTLKHEMIHIRQIRHFGVLRFYAQYLIEYLIGLLKTFSHDKAYRGISFEREAFELETVRLTWSEREALDVVAIDYDETWRNGQ